MQNSTGTELINLTSQNQGICLHNYSLLPNDMAQIEMADVFLTCGDDITSNIEIANKINAYPYDDDEHPWMNFESSIPMARIIANTLAEKDWKNKTTYLENADRFVEELRNMQAIMKNKIDALPNKYVISLDPTLTTFANSLGLNVITYETDSHETDSLANIPKYITSVTEYDIKAILAQDKTYTIKAITDEYQKRGEKIELIFLSPLLSGDNSANDYFNQINENFDKVYNALK
jgi:ABC-type Zn uptake system ZnuABC Zn-binding protein ZnuA